jgi:hypothetical protein
MDSIITLFLMIFGDFKLIAEISAIDSSLTAIFVLAFSLTVNIYLHFNFSFLGFSQIG